MNKQLFAAALGLAVSAEPTYRTSSGYRCWANTPESKHPKTAAVLRKEKVKAAKKQQRRKK